MQQEEVISLPIFHSRPPSLPLTWQMWMVCDLGLVSSFFVEEGEQGVGGKQLANDIGNARACKMLSPIF